MSRPRNWFSFSGRRSTPAKRSYGIDQLEDRTVLSTVGPTDPPDEVEPFNTATVEVLTASAGRVIHVATTGVDQTTGFSEDDPLRTIDFALSIAQSGDEIVVHNGVYNETLTTRRAGTSDARIVVRAENEGGVVITNSGRVLNVKHAFYTFEGLIFDGQFGDKDIVLVENAGNDLVFRNNEVRNGRRDGIDMHGPDRVLIENSHIHHLLWMENGVRNDAHGIVTSDAVDLVIRNTEVHHVSGDAFQAIYGSWDRITIEGSKFWNGPLETAIAGFAAGVNPGENAVDTKKYSIQNQGHLIIRNSEFFGWAGDFVANSSAFVLKHNISVVVDGVILRDNYIGIRARGGADGSEFGNADVVVMNSILYGNDIAIRYEDGIRNFKVLHNTFGLDNDKLFHRAPASVPMGANSALLNNLFMGTRPTEFAHGSNLSVDASVFVNAAGGNYRLRDGAAAISAGTNTSGHVPTWYNGATHVAIDFDGVARPQGADIDVGAFEWVATQVNEPPVIQPIADQVLYVNELWTLPLNVSDPNGDPMSFEFTGMPEGMTFDPLAKTLSWTPVGTDIGASAMTVVVRDGRDPSLTATASFNFAVETAPKLKVKGGTVTEGTGNVVVATFVVSLAAPSSGAITVDYATEDKTAKAGKDYEAALGTLVFAPGETSKTIGVVVFGDSVDEAKEQFLLRLSNANHGAIATASATFSIIDDDDPPVVAITDAFIEEGDSGKVLMTFVLTLSAASEQTVTLTASTMPGTASADVDYLSKSSSVRFKPGETVATFSVWVVGDTLMEGNEIFFINLSNERNASVERRQAAGTIVDDDVMAALRVDDFFASAVDADLIV